MIGQFVFGASGCFLVVSRFSSTDGPSSQYSGSAHRSLAYLIALIMLCPLLPHTSETTLVSLLVVVSKTLCNRLLCWVCCDTSRKGLKHESDEPTDELDGGAAARNARYCYHQGSSRAHANLNCVYKHHVL